MIKITGYFDILKKYENSVIFGTSNFMSIDSFTLNVIETCQSASRDGFSGLNCPQCGCIPPTTTTSTTTSTTTTTVSFDDENSIYVSNTNKIHPSTALNGKYIPVEDVNKRNSWEKRDQWNFVKSKIEFGEITIEKQRLLAWERVI